MNIRHRLIQPNGLGVGNEMDLVSALREFHTQLGGNHTAAAVGGVTGNPDLQGHADKMAGMGRRFKIALLRTIIRIPNPKEPL
jgi:hypothetical protein